jgi:hypothetical protein
MKRPKAVRAAFYLALLSTTAFGARVVSPRALARMTDAATEFLASLSSEQRVRATFAFESDERLRWHFIPNEMWARKGVMLKELTPAQAAAAKSLVQSGLSQRGYMTAASIMELERVLRVLEAGGRFARDHDEYFIAIFGTPAAKGTWAWRFEGHHLSLHFTVVGGSATVSSPTFFGSNPAEVRDGPEKGKRVLGFTEDAGRALLDALTPEQRALAVIAGVAPADIITVNKLPVEPLSPAGLRASAMTSPQRALLERLIDSYASLMADDIAAQRAARLRAAGLENVTFAWAGETERGRKHYYRVQGPTFLIEYDNTQNDGNHVHSVWRDFQGDFGRDLLRDHVRNTPH